MENQTKHTARRFVNCKLPCGCELVNDDRHTGIRQCSLHTAAPELLEAAKILQDPTRQLEHTPGNNFIFRLKQADVEKIAAAIAKAESSAEGH